MKRPVDEQFKPERKHKRIPYPPDLVVTYEGFEANIRVSGPNLSPNGMFINTPTPLPEGAVLTVKFRLTSVNCWVSARCEVRYSLPGVGVGVEFVDLSEESRCAILHEITELSKRIDESPGPADSTPRS